MPRSLGLIMAAALVLAAASVHAQTFDPRFPVCLHVFSGANGGGGDWYDCSFTSLPQCRATASGRSASCDLNPYYAFDQQPSPPRHRHRKVY
jgi:hypothetical protein